MSGRIFGTDGVRGLANKPPMTPDIIMRLAVATGQHFTNGDHRHIVIIGKDTRLSGYMVEPALTAGFIAAGMDVVLVGPLPTPGVAMLTRSMRADLGVVISASHNPYHDNGIKFFDANGAKLSDDVELEIESKVLSGSLTNLATPNELGKARRLDDAPGRYIEFVKNSFPKGTRLDGIKIVLDCANGAAYHIAPIVLWELGAEVITLNNKPDGFNINAKCGATAPAAMQQAVLDHKADVGIALDGDADRIVMSDNKGQLIDGDQLMGLIARFWHSRGLLKGDGIAGTVMSNLGLENFLKDLGLKLYRTPVGDRYVSSFMRENGLNIGGEQSGHIILNDFTTTGDGLVAALQALAVFVELQKPISEVAHVFKTVPQKLINIKLGKHDPLDSDNVQNAISECKLKLKNKGRLLIRKSGTEPLLRIMVECDDVSLLEETLSVVSVAIEAEVASHVPKVSQTKATCA
jgi:phosphoglucosamine mutase